MDENETNQPLMTSNQYPKEAVRKRQNSRNSGGSDSSRFSRKSFKLDYRLEEDVTKSKKGKDGRFVNPWPTWKNPSIPSLLRWVITERDHSSVPCSKEVVFVFRVLCICSFFEKIIDLFGCAGSFLLCGLFSSCGKLCLLASCGAQVFVGSSFSLRSIGSRAFGLQ